MNSEAPQPLISIITPVYNGHDTLERAIRSVREQTYERWEMLVVDDGSTDNTREIARRWATEEPRIRLICQSENSGPGAARNAGLRAAGGEWIAYLDHDDEYDSRYLEHVGLFCDKGDVLIFGYDVIHESEPGRPVVPWRPEDVSHLMFGACISTLLGVAHGRRWVDKIGWFNELAYRGEDSDYLQRMVREGAECLFLPVRSGAYHYHRGSLSTAPKLTPRQRTAIEANRRAGRPIFSNPSSKSKEKPIHKLAFASPHCLLDSTSGAAIATEQNLRFLSTLGFDCEAFCGARLDAPEEKLFEELLSEGKYLYESRRARIGDFDGRMSFVMSGEVGVTVFQNASTRGYWLDDNEAEAFLTAFGLFLDKNRPDAIITFGGDTITQGMILQAKCRDIPVVFWLHNFAYTNAELFRRVDYVVVPSDFSRQHYWQCLGLDCLALPNVIEPNRILAERSDPKYVTFVNPEPNKGVFVFAKIAEQLARRRPDIPLLVVEGRRQARILEQVGIDGASLTNLTMMANTPDPREFYGVTKVILMPSVCDESFGLVAAEAMTNGIPVLGSNRGSLPEILGAAGFVFDIPAKYTPAAQVMPTAEEVEPWVATIIRLWDDQGFYQSVSDRVIHHSRQWQPGQIASRYREFFSRITHQSSSPVVPRGRFVR